MGNVQHDSETAAHGQQVITACAFIWHNFDGIKKVFLPRRAATKKFLPNVFELPGGHVDFGEDIADGLRREILEEFGMHVSLGEPFASFTYTNDVKGSHSIEVVYFAQFTDPFEQIQLDPEDHSEYVWATSQDLPQIYSGPKTMDDPEAQIVARGLELINGSSLRFS